MWGGGEGGYIEFGRDQNPGEIWGKVRQAENGVDPQCGVEPWANMQAESRRNNRREQNSGKIWGGGNPRRTWGLVYGQGECGPSRPPSWRAAWQ